jgi:undecaprenyl-diphosphatase
MIDQIVHLDREVFLAINGLHNGFFDLFFHWYSNKWIWIPFYIFLLYFIVRDYRKRSWFILIGIALLITLSDQSSVRLFKDVFERLRPCHEPLLEGMVHIVNNKCGGSYGFISSHASNSFAVVGFLWIVYPKKLNILKIVLVVWALLMIYSRVYLGVHYPGDVLAGAVWGGALGLGLGWITLWIMGKVGGR